MAIAKWAPFSAFASLQQEMRLNVSTSAVAGLNTATPYRPRATGFRGSTV
jgi:hypothetical protein